MKIKYLLSLCLIVCCFAKVQAQENPPDVHALWDQILAEHLITLPGGHATQFNYQALAQKPEPLTRYLNLLSEVTEQRYKQWDKNTQLAFLLNAYNAFTVKWVIKHYPVDSIRDTGGFFSSPWSKSFISLLGQNVSLDTIEHEWIRNSGQFNEPRIHFAVNCASVGCPALGEQAYRATYLEKQLEVQTQRFMSDKSRNYVKANTLYLSSIFDWYEDDFEQGWLSINNLYQFALKYRNELGLNQAQVKQLKEQSLQIDFLKYDWSLNDVSSK